MFGMYTYIQRHCWLLFPSAAVLEQVNRFSSCIFQLNPNYKCVCVSSVCVCKPVFPSSPFILEQEECVKPSGCNPGLSVEL